MANLLASFSRNKRQTVSLLFTLTFLGSVAIVAIPCPAPSRRNGVASLDSPPANDQEPKVDSRLERQLRAERARRKFGFLSEGGR